MAKANRILAAAACLALACAFAGCSTIAAGGTVDPYIRGYLTPPSVEAGVRITGNAQAQAAQMQPTTRSQADKP